MDTRATASRRDFIRREHEEVFTSDGFYRTGDMGYIEEGLVFFQSRRTDMIKTKGANVAPAEVEMILVAFPDILAAFVVGLPHDQFGQEVAAAVVTRHGDKLDNDVLQRYLGEQLSPYKVPTVILEVAEGELPYLPSSKVDRRELARRLAQRRASI